ncbi:hypothetical protein FQR65_LT15832 [Abscondita terminalis]|nr:hypothetical protein FQR65_LT15832 [Abscondita terminalis]
MIYSIAVGITMLFLTMCLKLYFQNQQLKEYEKMLGFWRKAAKFVRIGLQTIIYSIAVGITMLFLTMCLKLYFQNKQIKEYEKMLAFWRKAAKFELDYKLLLACYDNDICYANFLLDCGASVHTITQRGDTPLLMCLRKSPPNASNIKLIQRNINQPTMKMWTPIK